LQDQVALTHHSYQKLPLNSNPERSKYTIEWGSRPSKSWFI